MAIKRYYPEQFNVVTPSDDVGSSLDLTRITGEDLYTYKKRVLDSSQRVANSTYEGLINGINRELGLDRIDLMQINLKKKIHGVLSHQEILFSSTTITDERTYVGIIDGTNVVAVNNTLRTTQHIWEPDQLIGMSLVIDGNAYLIESNTRNTITVVGGEFSNLIGANYQIRVIWEENELIGMACYIGLHKYTITENTDNTIRLDGVIKAEGIEDYYITANKPRIQITSSRMILYKEYTNENNYQLDIEISLREDNIQHTDIVDIINKESDFFVAQNLIEGSSTYPAFIIRQQDSNVQCFSEIVPGSRYFRFKNQNIQKGTVQFVENSVFLREVDNIEDMSDGAYYSIDYAQGIVKSKNVPSGKSTVSYIYADLPFTVEATPAVITPFVDEDSKNFLFAQKEKLIYEDQRDRFVSSQPKGKMIEYIAELLAVSNQSWGK